VTVDTLESVVSRSPNPYPGPRPFHRDESRLFFGRDHETSQLRSLVLANSLVLLYAQSGAGKTSLVHAGLIPALSERNATVLPVLRIGPTGNEDCEAHIENAYVRSVVVNWAAAADEHLSAIASLPDFIALLASRSNAPLDEPRILIVDQFEEIFTSFPEHWTSRGDFFAQLDLALAADPELRVLLSMREDYVAQTDPYASLISNHLQQRFRIETLRKEQALAAVTCPLIATDREFADGAAEYLVDQLLQIRIERNGRLEQVPGEYVEPVQLQVVCQRVWDELPSEVTEITEQDLRAFGNVDQVLSNFYASAVRDAAQVARTREPKLRNWIETTLITSVGTRGTAHRQAALEAGVPQTAMDQLVDKHLLRAEPRAGSEWYELTHDRLIGPIQFSNARFRDAAVKKRLRLAALIGGLAVVMAGAAAIYVLLTRTGTTKLESPALSTSSTPVPPTITTPVDGRLYRLGSLVRAKYSCRATVAATVTSCVGPVSPGAPIKTKSLGPHTFTVTASNQAAGIGTTRSVSYTVVAFAAAAYDGHAFTIYYPSHWHITDSEKPQPGGYTDTTIVSPTDPTTFLRVDVKSRRAIDPEAAAKPVIKAVSSEAGYHLLALRRIAFRGLNSVQWEFVVQENGVPLRKEDDFFSDSKHGESFAVLTQASASRFPDLARQFASLRKSLIIK
jgi:hypothetical protein